MSQLAWLTHGHLNLELLITINKLFGRRVVLFETCGGAITETTMPSTHQSKDIDAPILEVWVKFNNFHDLSWAPNVIEKIVKVGNIDGGEVGAKRILNNVFRETHVGIDHDKHTLKYSIDDGPSPVSKEEVSNYYGVVKLSQIDQGNKTHVEWYSSWESNVEDAVEFCHRIYVALLNELAESFN